MNQKGSQSVSDVSNSNVYPYGVQNYSVAWFKLAHLIEKREKEKALSVFRLLTYSLRDKAYSLQLEGDILWALNDEVLAKEKYATAALIYQKDRRWIHAVALYESLLANNFENYSILTSIILCYAQLGWEDKFKQKLDKIFELLFKDIHDENKLSAAIKHLSEMAKDLHNENLKAILSLKLQGFLSSIPKGAAETVEHLFKKI